MVERLLIKALQGGENTKIMTFTGKKIKKMPSTLEKLPALKTLDLQNNLIPEVCPEIRTLTQLTSLNLGNNLLEAVPEELKYLVSLRKLHLFGNRICRFASGVCDGLQNLILLNLNNNQLTWLPQEIGRLKSLVYMSINHNQLAIIPTELCSLLNLVELQLNYNQVIYIPEEIKFLKDLQKLLLARNNIKALPNFQNLKLREFYCEGNPLLLKRPVITTHHKDIWSLQISGRLWPTSWTTQHLSKQNRKVKCAVKGKCHTKNELTSRFVMDQLEEKNPLLMNAIDSYPQVRDIISPGKKCAICGKPFLTIWLECVQFIHPSKNCKVSRNLQLVPVQILICSYRCFMQRSPNVFGVADA
ncbi:leucine-rich repeat-containing protein 69 isoform X2 [Tupaia chinensis]|uniref:leucine-rich repeat-containing protein 69 isoform X2 n=1 Tax=Tupaia chinensis TaxID=246437 RepID=UPI0003C90E86|nr:leucine-rich repeat-containing protein 69 isoform X2 [Tupaia chinensis]